MGSGKKLKRFFGSKGKTVTVCVKTTNTNTNEDDYYDPIVSAWSNTNTTAYSITPVKGQDLLHLPEGGSARDYYNIVLPYDTTVNEGDLIIVDSVNYKVYNKFDSHDGFSGPSHIRVLVRREVGEGLK